MYLVFLVFRVVWWMKGYWCFWVKVDRELENILIFIFFLGYVLYIVINIVFSICIKIILFYIYDMLF